MSCSHLNINKQNKFRPLKSTQEPCQIQLPVVDNSTSKAGKCKQPPRVNLSMCYETQRFRCGHKVKVPVGCDKPESAQGPECVSERRKTTVGVLMRPEMCQECTPLGRGTGGQTESHLHSSGAAMASSPTSVLPTFRLSQIQSSIDSHEPPNFDAYGVSRRVHDHVAAWIEDQSLTNPPVVGSKQAPEIMPLMSHKIARKPVRPSYAGSESYPDGFAASLSSAYYSYQAPSTGRAQVTAENVEKTFERKRMSAPRDSERRSRKQANKNVVETQALDEPAQFETTPRTSQTSRQTQSTDETEWPRISPSPVTFPVGFENPRKAPKPPAMQSPRREIGKPTMGYAEHCQQNGKRSGGHKLPSLLLQNPPAKTPSLGSSPLSFSFMKSLWRSPKTGTSPRSEASSPGKPPISPMRKLGDDLKAKMQLKRKDSTDSFACVTASQQSREGRAENAKGKAGHKGK